MKARNALLALIGIVLLVSSCSSGGDDNGNTPGPSGGSAGFTTGGGAGVGGSPFAGSGGNAGNPNQCPVGQAPCNGVCASTQSDPSNCGACGSVCVAPQTCTNGSCSCAVGSLTCPTGCVDGQNDEANCGACGTACGAGELCTTGACACQAGQMRCAGTNQCTDTMSNPMNCGTCGNVCPTTAPFCQAGVCSATCTLTTCGTAPNQTCINVMGTDPLNCGACGMACPAGQSCTAGVCGCPTGQMNCNGSCVNVMGTDVNNCGACGTACPTGQSCTAGTCACAQGQTSCGMPATCVDTQTNNAHCGACGATCAGTCMGGQCMTTGGRPAGCPPTANMISDFEEGTGVMVPQGSRTGYWYVYSDPTAGSLTPPVANNAPVAAAMLPPGDMRGGMCNRFAMRSASTNHPQYVGFGASFLPGTTPANKMPYNASQYTGIKFWIRSNAGTAPPIWFEVLTRENQPADGGGVALNNAVDMYNTRGKLLTGIGTTWTQVTLPFVTMGPRYLPSTAVCTGNIMCEAPTLNLQNVLGFQFSLYDQFSSTGAYDLWVDEVEFVTGDPITAPAQATGNFKFPQDRAMMNGCRKPAGATGKHLLEAFQLWKATFTEPAGGGIRVKFDNPSETVSEGIAYGMLIAVFMNDKPLFDGLWTYWKANGGNLMTWKIPGGSGSASDADEDAAFALIQAERQWGGYATDANNVLGAFRAFDGANPRGDVGPGNVLRPGNQFGLPTQDITNPSYFAPAFYRVFAAYDTAGQAVWNGLATSVHQYLNRIEARVTSGLVPAWCLNGCDAIYTPGAAGTSYVDGQHYQYDSHRTPWRMALDACWYNNTDARQYVTSTSTFFSTQAAQGMGRLFDVYTTSGAQGPMVAQNSMSLIGTAGVGAMASSTAAHQAFADRAYRFILDASAIGAAIGPTNACATGGNAACTQFNTSAKAVYKYYNATVGLLTALTMTGNFNNLSP